MDFDVQDGQAGAERRSDQRQTTLFQVARITLDDGKQHLCLIRNIGPGGLQLETYTQLPFDGRVLVEPKACDPLAGRIAWSTVNRAGVEFDAPIDVAAYLGQRALGDGAAAPRAPRLAVSRPARLRIGPMWEGVEIVDVSQRGAKIEIDHALQIGEEVLLQAEGLAPVPAWVRWSEEGRAGLEFPSAIPLAQLALWAESVSREGLAA